MRLEDIEDRRVVVVRHDGSEESVDDTRRPLYQELIMQEAVGGPSMMRFENGIEVLVEASPGFIGGEQYPVQTLPGGTYAVDDFEGPVDDIAAARDAFLERVRTEHEVAAGLIQVHIMDAIEGEIEQQFQVLLRSTL